MSNTGSMVNHYSRNDLVRSIQSALEKTGVDIKNVTVNDLAPVDEFHTGGRVATAHLLEHITVQQGERILDIGCGIGGTGRYLADRYAVTVSGIDLTEEYIETAEVLNEWVSLSDKIDLTVGNATALPYSDGEFDIAIMLHVGMNVIDKTRLVSEVYRVLNKGGRFILYDVMKTNDSEFSFPVPWAGDSSMSYLETSETYTTLLESAGFTVRKVEGRGEFCKDIFERNRKNAKSSTGPSPVGLQLLMGPEIREKMKNFSKAIFDDTLEPTEIVAVK